MRFNRYSAILYIMMMIASISARADTTTKVTWVISPELASLETELQSIVPRLIEIQNKWKLATENQEITYTFNGVK